MDNYNVSGEWNQPYHTNSLLWGILETQGILDEMDSLESQLKTTALAAKMLKDIGVNVN
jgi:hypothetical protein